MAHTSTDGTAAYIGNSIQTSEGKPCSISWKIWNHDAGVVWELRRIISHIDHAPTSLCNKFVKKNLELWKAWWGLSGLDAEEHFKHSRNACLQKRPHLLNDPRLKQEYIVSTLGLVDLLLCFHSSRKRLEDRAMAKNLLKCLLGKLLQPESTNVQLFQVIPAEVKSQACPHRDEALAAHGPCPHARFLQEMFLKIEVMPPQSWLAAAACLVAAHRNLCPATRLWHFIAIRDIAQALDSAIGSGIQGLQRLPATVSTNSYYRNGFKSSYKQQSSLSVSKYHSRLSEI